MRRRMVKGDQGKPSPAELREARVALSGGSRKAKGVLGGDPFRLGMCIAMIHRFVCNSDSLCQFNWKAAATTAQPGQLLNL
jgi:hypothetical protein